mgnify:CR=1 FL=1|jgi:hypothetical protein
MVKAEKKTAAKSQTTKVSEKSKGIVKEGK